MTLQRSFNPEARWDGFGALQKVRQIRFIGVDTGEHDLTIHSNHA
jgi:hypothetical protein